MEDASHLLELLEALEAGVLALDRPEVDPAVAVHRVFQSAHNLKSGLAMAGLNRASGRFHGLEDGLDDLRRGRLIWSPAWADAVLDTVDRVRGCLHEGHDDELDPVFARPAEESGRAATVTTEEAGEGARAEALGERLFRIEKLFLPGLERTDFEGHLIYEDIAANGTLISVTPGWDEYARATGEVVVRFLFRSPQTAEQLSEVFFDPLIEVPLPPAPAQRLAFRILVVDDDDLMAQVLARSVATQGTITVALDGAEGLSAFQRAFAAGEGFDVVILDLEMPEVDGHAVLDGLRAHEETHGVLGLDRCLVYMNTSHTELPRVKASFRLQADRYFIKPGSLGQIQQALEAGQAWLLKRRKEGF